MALRHDPRGRGPPSPVRASVLTTLSLDAVAPTGSGVAPVTVIHEEDRPAGIHRPNVLFILADDLGHGDLSCYGRSDSARVGRWKYLKTAKGEFLFDLSVDPGEKADLRSKQPGIFEEIRRKYQGWNAQMLPMPSKQS